jgi:predicted short-subunit dehydrogenase-like oxidoreductase (DUF2520 family)
MRMRVSCAMTGARPVSRGDAAEVEVEVEVEVGIGRL